MSVVAFALVAITAVTIYIWYKLCSQGNNKNAEVKEESKAKEETKTDCTFCCRDWASLNIYKGTLTNCLEPNYDLNKIKVSYPIKNEDHIIYLTDLLSKNECESLINKTNNLEYLKLEGFKGKVRSNKRRRTFDEKMSEIMFNRIKKYVPKYVIIDDCKWELNRIMDYWRYCKYNPGEHFSPHYDGSKVLLNDNTREMSVFTINIYLNDCFIGGGTRFTILYDILCLFNVHLYKT